MGRSDRSTREVLEDHLRKRGEDDLERDIETNYAPDVVLLSYEGVHRGHDGVRKLAEILASYVGPSDYEYDAFIAMDEYGLLRWSANGAETTVHDGVDSFVVREGLIQAQTIHYSTSPKDD